MVRSYLTGLDNFAIDHKVKNEKELV